MVSSAYGSTLRTTRYYAPMYASLEGLSANECLESGRDCEGSVESSARHIGSLQQFRINAVAASIVRLSSFRIVMQVLNDTT